MGVFTLKVEFKMPILTFAVWTSAMLLFFGELTRQVESVVACL